MKYFVCVASLFIFIDSLSLVDNLLAVGLQTFYDTGPRPLLWPGSRAVRGKVTVSDTPTCLNYYCKMFILCTQITNVAVGRKIQPGGPSPIVGPLVGDPCFYNLKCLLRCLTLRRLMSYIYGAPILDVSRSHTTTQHSR